MKKVLLGTSAIALACAFASPAAAAEWEVKVGGYSNQAIGYGNSNPDFGIASDGTPVPGAKGSFDGVDVLSNTEVFFLPSITLDNGVKFGMNIQLEGNTSGDQIDESYMYITGSFGEIDIGSENSAGYKMTYAAPSVAKVPINSGSMSAWIPFDVGGSDLFRGTLGSSFIEVGENNDSQRITYYTPRIAGFQIGASYARDGKQDSSSATDSDTNLHDIFDVGANYVNTFGDFNVAISGRYGTASAPGAKDPEVWSAGAQLGYAGFTIGGAYAKSAKSGNQNGYSWDAGASYETGPWAFSGEYFYGRNVDNDHTSSKETYKAAELAANYKLAKGVTLFGFGAWVDYNGDGSYTTSVQNAPAGGGVVTTTTTTHVFDASVEGWVVGTGVGLNW